VNEIQTSDFDYSLVSNELAEKLKEKDYTLIGLHSKYSKEVGKVLYEAQRDFADYNNGGLFEKWYTSRGFKKTNVYQYINIYSEVQNLNGGQLEVFEGLPKTLQVETSKKNADPELKEQVLSGDITTHKKYKELEQAKQQAEQQTEQAKKSEQIMQKQLEESESKKPETIEVIKEVESEDLQRQLRFSQKENERLSEKQEHHKLKDTTNFNEEEAKLEMKKLQSEADRTTVEIRIAFKKLNDRVSVSRYLSDAISCGNDYEKKKMSEEITITENILRDIKTAILGRKEIN